MRRRDFLLLCAPALALLGAVRSKGKRATERDDEVGGDGGPLVVLQGAAAARWQGASGWDSSLMNGGNVETDYDVACSCKSYITRRYSRDMLVLEDSEWGGRILSLPSGAVALVQRFGSEEEIPALLSRIEQAKPLESFLFAVEDASLRLQPGAEGMDLGPSSFADVPIAPGAKRCDVYRLAGALIITINAA